ATVEQVAAAIEHGAIDAGLLRGGGKGLPHFCGLRGLVAVAALADIEPRRGCERAAGVVVDELGEDAAVRAEHDQTRPLGRAADLAAHAPVATQACLAGAEPRAQRTRSSGSKAATSAPCEPPSSLRLMPASRPCDGRTRPRSGCPCPCRA